LYFRKTNIYVLQMKKNYNSLTRGVGHVLSPPENNSKEFACWRSRPFKVTSLLIAAFLMLATLQVQAQTSYCTPAPTSVDGIGIININIGSINNSSTDEPGHYGDYSAQIVNVGQGVEQAFSITYSTGFTYDTKIWVDWNNDFDFTDEGEEVYAGISTNVVPTILSGTFTVPVTATLGNHRLRIGGQDNGPAAPCYVGSYGSFEDYTINVTAPPACFTPSGLAATNVSAGLVNLSWSAPTLGTTPAGYEYVVSTTATTPANGTPTTAVTTTTANNVTVPTNVTGYVYLRTNCGNGSFSEWVSVPFYNGLCIPSSLFVNGGGITNVAIGSINNTTTTEPSNYGNFSAQVVNIGQGVTQMFSITLNTFDAFNVKIWVDWNDNLTFDEGEEVYSGVSDATATAVLSGTFTVPATATLGNHRLRIGGMAAWSGVPTPCSTNQYYSVFEDYTINVTTPPTCYTPSAVAAVNAGSGLINISWAAPTLGTAPAGYQYVIDASSNIPAANAATTTTATSVNNVPVTVNVTGYLHVRTSCGGTDYSEWVTIPFYNGVCIPAPTSIDDQGITNVTIGTINNTTTDEPGHYADYSAQVVSIGQGVTQSFSITFTTNGATYVTKIWVDWNDDLDFDDEGEEIFSGESGNTEPATLRGSFTVPATASFGNHRMRIGGSDFGPTTPCFSGVYGSFEDYTVNVTTPPSCFTPTEAVGIGTASGLANLSWIAPTLGGPATGYEYIVDTNEANPANGATAISTTATIVTGYTGIADSVYYYLHVRTNCGGGDYSQWITSPAFRYLQGDTCATAISLDGLTSPISSATTGAGDEYTPQCGWGSSPDIYYSITVPNGYVLVAGLNESNYSTATSIYYGNCTDQTLIQCRTFSNDGTTWENTTGSTQTVYWVQDGYFGGAGDFTLAWTLTPPPACNVPRNVLGTMTSLTTADISWTVPITGNPVSYDYAVTQSGDAPEDFEVTTSLSITNITTVANAYNWVWVRTNCAGNDGSSQWRSYKFYSGHCVPVNLNGGYNNIVSFSTSVGFSNISNTQEQFTPYENLFNTMVVGQEPGGSFNYAVTIDSYSAVDIWIDWNNDLDFEDAGETIASHSNQVFADGEFTGSISIPGVIAAGNYRMRLRSRSSWSESDPCDEYYSGTAQDYAINIGDPPTCYVPINLSGVTTAPGTANLSWAPQNLGDAPVGYEYFVTTSTTNPDGQTAIATTATTVAGYTGLIDNTWYYLYVRTNCGDGDYSQWAVSTRFRYLAGDTCASAVDLSTVANPYSYSTIGAGSDYTSSCNVNGAAPDLYYYVTVPNGYTFTGNQTSSNYDSVHSVFYGTCGNQTIVECLGNTQDVITWENGTGSTQTVYWVQDGWGLASGEFTFTWSLTPPAPCDRPRQLDVNLTSLTTADISWILPNTGTAVGYEYAVTTSNQPPISGTYTTATSATGVTVTPNVNSYLYVRTVCSTADGNSIWVPLPFFSGYCVPANTSSTSNYITGVSSTGGDANFSSTSTGFSAFTDNTATHSVTTYPGGSFALQATTPNATTEYLYSVWIDWNNNFDFTDTGERVRNTGYLTSPASLGEITIPLTAAVGTYRMRIRNARFTAPVMPCGEIDGEAEDFTLNIVPAPSCFPPFNPGITPTDTGYANLNWSIPQLGGVPTGYEYVFGPSATAPAEGVSGTPSTSFFVGDAEYDPTQSVYLFVRTNCGGGDFSTWATTQILGTNSPDFLANSITVYKEGNAINITSGTTLMKGVTIYDTRGRKLYSQTDINNTETAITGLQIQQQVVIVEVNTVNGKVSKRIVF